MRAVASQVEVNFTEVMLAVDLDGTADVVLVVCHTSVNVTLDDIAADVVIVTGQDGDVPPVDHVDDAPVDFWTLPCGRNLSSPLPTPT